MTEFEISPLYEMKTFITRFKIWNKMLHKKAPTRWNFEQSCNSLKYFSPLSSDAFIKRALGVLKIDLFSENWALKWKMEPVRLGGDGLCQVIILSRLAWAGSSSTKCPQSGPRIALLSPGHSKGWDGYQHLRRWKNDIIIILVHQSLWQFDTHLCLHIVPSLRTVV